MVKKDENRIRCLAIDDEPLALQQLAKYIEQVPYLMLVKACSSALEARQVMERDDIDAIFIDINMPDLNGLDFVRSLTLPPIVVFTTAYSEYAVEGYKVDALDYLLKPFGLDEFTRAAEKVKRQHDLQNQHASLQFCEDDSMFVKTDYKIVRIAINDIIFIEAMSEYLRIHVVNRDTPYTVLMSMRKMEESLPRQLFMRVHRSYIINLRRIVEVNRNHISLGPDISLPVGDLYKEAFSAYLNKRYISR